MSFGMRSKSPENEEQGILHIEIPAENRQRHERRMIRYSVQHLRVIDHTELRDSAIKLSDQMDIGMNRCVFKCQCHRSEHGHVMKFTRPSGIYHTSRFMLGLHTSGTYLVLAK